MTANRLRQASPCQEGTKNTTVECGLSELAEIIGRSAYKGPVSMETTMATASTEAENVFLTQAFDAASALPVWAMKYARSLMPNSHKD